MLAKLTALQKEISRNCLERHDVVLGMMLALLTKNHLFLWGKPGTAKSFGAKLLLNSVQGCKKLCKQITRQMTEEAVFGPLDIIRWRKHGEYVYKTSGGLADVQLALLEEYFDGSDALVRSMNEVLNEREFSRSLIAVKNCPLHTCVATSNFFRTDGDAEAVADRFLIRVQTNPLSETNSRFRMIRNFINKGIPRLNTVMTFKEIEYLHKKCREVIVSHEIIEAYEQVTSEYQKILGEKLYVSDRRIAWSSILIQAAAVLRGSDTASMEDIDMTKFGLAFIGKPQETDAFDKAYFNVVGIREAREKAQKIIDSSIEEYAGIEKQKIAAKTNGKLAVKCFNDLQLMIDLLNNFLIKEIPELENARTDLLVKAEALLNEFNLYNESTEIAEI